MSSSNAQSLLNTKIFESFDEKSKHECPSLIITKLVNKRLDTWNKTDPIPRISLHKEKIDRHSQDETKVNLKPKENTHNLFASPFKFIIPKKEKKVLVKNNIFFKYNLKSSSSQSDHSDKSL